MANWLLNCPEEARIFVCKNIIANTTSRRVIEAK